MDFPGKLAMIRIITVYERQITAKLMLAQYLHVIYK
jgi:hypothetical protein